MTESKVSKHQHVDIHDNKELKSLDKYEDKGDRYVLLPSPPQKESNCLIDLRKKTKSLNYLIYIPKISQLDNYSLCIRVLR